MLAVERAGRHVYVATVEGLPYFVDADAAGGQRARVELHPHGVLLRAEDLHLRDTGDGRDALGEVRLRVLVDGVERQGRGAQRQIEHRLLSLIHISEPTRLLSIS